MTKKEIEERLCKEMQQNIPDKDALWQKIEQNLPEQPVSQPVRKSIRMTSGKSLLALAACLLLIIAGRQYLQAGRIQKQSEEIVTPAGENSSAASMDVIEDAEAAGQPEDMTEKIISYQNLNISHEKTIASQVNLSRLGTGDSYFNEDAILENTAFFIDVRVTDGWQDSASGNMHYDLEILDVYGGNLEKEKITLETSSAYILEQNHEYVLPVTADLSLAYECAPQIEKTQDSRLVIPNGWYTLMQSDVTPVLYDSYGEDDYFYDRMYLTKDLNLDLLIQKWESL